MPPLSKFEWWIVSGSLAVWALVIAGGHRFVADDVFFYLRIADGIVTGQGSSFNGIIHTNGYHPLWMLFCVFLRTFVSDRERLIQALFVLCAVLHVASLVLLGTLLRHGGVTHRWPALLVLACFLVTVPSGSEFHISILLLLLTLDRVTVLYHSDATPRQYTLLGIAAGFALLARLDNIFFVTALLLAAVCRPSAALHRLRGIVFTGVMVALIVSPYLAWNWLSFGAFVPISGAVKAAFAKPGIAKLGARGLCVSLGAMTLPLSRPRWTRFAPSLLGAITLGAAAHTAYVVIRMTSVWQWYFASEVLATSLAASLWTERLIGASGSLRLPATIRTASRLILAAGLLSLAFLQRMRELQTSRVDRSDWYIDAARVIDETVAPGEGIATTIAPGGIGYYSHRGVFAFDGLTLDYAFHREAGREGLTPYLLRHHINHLFTVAPNSKQAMTSAEMTRTRGPVEGTAYYAAPDGHTVDSLEVFSSLLGCSLGSFDLTHLPLERQHVSSADIAIWRLN